MHGIISKARLAAVLAASAAAIAPTTARADDACPSSTADAYSMTAGALTGPSKTDVTLTVEAAAGCEPARSIKHIQIKTFTADGDLAAVLNLHDREAEDGIAEIALRRIARGVRIEAHAEVQTEAFDIATKMMDFQMASFTTNIRRDRTQNEPTAAAAGSSVG